MHKSEWSIESGLRILIKIRFIWNIYSFILFTLFIITDSVGLSMRLAKSQRLSASILRENLWHRWLNISKFVSTIILLLLLESWKLFESSFVLRQVIFFKKGP